jgi:hypothetical protein
MACALTRTVLRRRRRCARAPQSRRERRHLGLRAVDVALAAQVLGSQPLKAAQLALGFGAAHDDLGEVGTARFELRRGEIELRPQGLVVELRQELALVDRHTFLDEHGRDLARDFRRHRRFAPRDDVARGVQHRGAGRCAAVCSGRRDGRRELDLDRLLAQQPVRAGGAYHGDEHERDDPAASARRRALGESRSIFRLSSVFWSSDTSVPPRNARF